VLLAFTLGPAELFIIVASIVTVGVIMRARARSRTDAPSDVRQRSSASPASIVLLVLLTLIGAWFFLPGLFDGNSRSLLGSKTRRSPIADIAGPREVVERQIQIQEDMVQRFQFPPIFPPRYL
jgi:hypothetical protein